MKFGAIDIGTNAARLLVGEVTKEDGHFFVNKVSYTRIPLRLGGDVFENGRISKKKVDHFVKTMKAFSLIAEIFEVKDLRACATSAMREAKNSKVVREKILNETGVSIDVISGDVEAELIFGTFFLLDIDKSVPFMVIDVGGGSTEVSVFEKGQRVASKSFEIGTLRLLKGKTRLTIWEEMQDWIDQSVDLSEVHTIYGTGGNINKAHKLLGAGHMQPLTLDKLEALKDELEPLSLKQRMDRYQLKPDRADVLVPALDIYCYLMKKLKYTDIIVPKIGLSDGIVYDLHMKHKKRLKVDAV